MNPSTLLFVALLLVSLFHPHLREKWTWAAEVLRGGVSWGSRFRPIDTFDLVLHTALTLGAIAGIVRSFRSGGAP